jgi:hypothetical protein
MATPIARFQALLACGPILATLLGFVGALVGLGVGAGWIGWAAGGAGLAAGVIRGALVGVAVGDNIVLVRNYTRTYWIPYDRIVQVINVEPGLNPGVWMPALVIADQIDPVAMKALSVPMSQFLARTRGWQFTLIWQFRWGRTPGPEYGAASRFEPLSNVIAARGIPVAPQWAGLLVRPRQQC